MDKDFWRNIVVFRIICRFLYESRFRREGEEEEERKKMMLLYSLISLKSIESISASMLKAHHIYYFAVL